MKTYAQRLLAPLAVAAALALTSTFALAASPAQDQPTPTIDPIFAPPGSEPAYATPAPDSPLPTPDPALMPLDGSAPLTGTLPVTLPVDAQPQQPEAPIAPVAPVQPTPPPPPLTADQLLNMAVIVPSYSITNAVQFVNGSYVIGAIGATVRVDPIRVALGDLNGDGADDAAALLETTLADGTTRQDLAIFLNQGGQPVPAAAIALDNPVRVDALRVEKGAVWLDVRVPSPTDDPLNPSLAVKRIYVLRGAEILELPAASYGKLFPYRYGRLTGYVNVLGEFVVPPRYVVADAFVEGLALVSRDGARFGFINRLGQEVIPLEYLSATPFDGGISVAVPALVGGVANTQGAVVYIDRMGRNIFGETTFGAGQPFTEGLAGVQMPSGKFGFIDRTGGLVILAQYDYVLPFSEGLAAVLEGAKVGYINRNGDMVIEPQFDAADLFAEGVAAVGVDTQVGFIDHAGNFAIAPTYARAEGFVEGLAVALLDGKEVYVDHTGAAAIFTPEFTNAQSFSEGLAAVKVGDRFGYLNPRGVIAIEPQFVVAGPFQDGLAVVETTNAWGVINAEGMWLVNLTLLQPATAQAGALTAAITSTGANTITNSVVTTVTLPLTAPVAAPGTQLIAFAPDVPSEIRQGACYAGSDLLPSPTAWRCGVTGGEVFDPCLLATDGATVVCGANPATGAVGFALQMTDVLPAVQIEQKIYPGAWLFQLGNGALCIYNQGTSITVEGQRTNYTCDDLTQLLGDIDKSGPVWTVNIVTLSDDGQGNYAIETLTPMTVVRAWVVQ